MIAGSFGLRASKISVTRGRPEVMSRGALRFLRLTCQLVARLHDLSRFHVDTGFRRQEVEVQNLAVGRIDNLDLRVTFALVLDDDEPPRAALAFRFNANRFAFFDVLEFHPAGLLGQNWYAVGIPARQLLVRLDGFAFLHEKVSTVRNLLTLDLATLCVNDGDVAVTLQHDLLLVAFEGR